MKDRKKLSVGTTLLLILLAVVVTFNITFFVAADFYESKFGDYQQLSAKYRKLEEIDKVVDKYFVGEYEEDALMDGVASGYVSALGDKWSAYFTAEQYRQIKEQQNNSYVGIGITISTAEENPYEITAVTKGSPAEAAGIQPLDKLASVDGKAVSEFGSVDEVVDTVRGEVGTKVTIGVERGGQTLTFEMERADVYNEQVEARMLQNNIGYVSISGFENNVDVEFKQKVNELVEQGARAMIFDVRFNPGGYVNVLASMLDILLPEGTIISMTDKDGNQMETYKSDAECLNLPMAVITNEYSISAAEFFAAACQEYGVADIVGDKTTGKGYAQTMVPLSDGSAVNISRAEYFTPKGKSLANTGVTPDHEVSLTEEQFAGFASLTDEQDTQLQKAIEVVTEKLLGTATAPAA